MRLTHAHCAVLFALTLGGCDDDVSAAGANLDGGVDACMEADQTVSLRLQNDPALVALRSCAVDADCTLQELPTIACPERGVTLPSCSLPIASVNLDAGIAYLAALERELCPTLPRDCRVGISCVPASPRCTAGRCTTAPRTADAGAP